jgi:hypothetical protein
MERLITLVTVLLTLFEHISWTIKAIDRLICYWIWIALAFVDANEQLDFRLLPCGYRLQSRSHNG